MVAANTVLDRLLDPLSKAFTPDVAREIAGLRADPETQERIDYLAERCNEGQLTEDERSEYEAIVRMIDFISILQAKARAILATGPDACR